MRWGENAAVVAAVALLVVGPWLGALARSGLRGRRALKAGGSTAAAGAGAPPWRAMAWRAVVATAFVTALPWGLGAAGERLVETARQDLGACDPDALGTAAQADRLRRAQAVFPGFARAADRGRALLLDSVVHGIRYCAHDAPPSAQLVDDVAAFIGDRLPKLADTDEFPSLRSRVERFLYARGRDRLLVELANFLPGGGDVSERVRAHLRLGDLEGAAEVWRHPDAEGVGSGVLSRGNVLCMAGDYPGALEAFAAELERRDRGIGRRHELVRYAECLRRAGKLEEALRAADEAAAIEHGASAAGYVRALIAEDRGDIDAALAAATVDAPAGGVRGAGARELLALSVLAGQDKEASRTELAERWPALSADLPFFDLYRKLGVPRTTAQIYRVSSHPVLDEARLEAVAAWFRRAPEASEILSPRGDAGPWAEKSARARAGRFYLALAMRQARRLDPRADESFDIAESLRPDDPQLRSVRRVMSFFHGDWDAPSEEDPRAVPGAGVPDVTFDDLRAAYRGERSFDGDADAPQFEFETSFAHVYSEEFRDEQRLEFLLAHRATTWPEQFYRLTNLVVHGRHMGFEVSEYEEQLAALRAMFAAQPNPILLAGVDGTRGL